MGVMRAIVFSLIGAAAFSAIVGVVIGCRLMLCLGDDGAVEDLVFKTAAPEGYDIAALGNRGQGRWRVVVVLGAPSRHATWRRFAMQADKDLEYIIVNRPGYGPSGPREAVLDFGEQVEAFLPMISDPARPCVALMGVSYAAQLALKAAVEHAEHVDALVIVSGLMSEPYEFQRALANVAAVPGIRSVLPRWWRNAHAEVKGRRGRVGPVLARADEISVPVEVIHGTWDMIVPVGDAALLMSRLAEGRGNLTLLPRRNHYLFAEEPAAMRAAARRAIARAEAQGTCLAETSEERPTR